MDQYISEKFTILDGTLLACSEQGENVVIPSSADGHPIRRIGSGLSIGKNAGTLILQEGIEEIGSSAFADSESLRSVYLPASLKKCENEIFSSYCWNENMCMYLKRRFSREEYADISENSILLVNGSHLLCKGYENMPQFTDIFAGFSWVSVPAMIDPRMHGLYQNKNKSRIPEQYPFAKMRGVVKVNSLYNEELFRRDLTHFIFREKEEVVNSCECELDHDRKLQSTIPRRNSNIILAYYADRDVEEQEDGVTVNVHLHFGPVFFVSLIKLVYSGKPFFIFRESYLSCDKKVPYTHQDCLDYIYDGKGNLVDKLTAKEVSGKYNLMSMLI